MAVSLSLLAGAAWHAARVSALEAGPPRLLSPVAVSPPVVLSTGAGTQELSFGGNIRFSDQNEALATQVALKEEK